MINDDELRAFQAIATEKSFSRAATSLGVSQASISQRMARLEARLGRTLVRRTTRTVELEPVGKVLLAYTGAILSMVDDIRRNLQNPPIAGSVRIGVSEELAYTRLSTILEMFKKQHPHFEIHRMGGRNYQLFRALDENKLDIVLGKCALGRSRGEALRTEPLVWAGTIDGVNVKHSHVPLLAYARPSETREIAERSLVTNHWTWSVVAESDNFLGLIAAAQAGLGVLPIGQSFMAPGLVDISTDLGLPTLEGVTYIVDFRADAGTGTEAMAALLRSLVKNA